jgi:hypothetical protein
MSRTPSKKKPQHVFTTLPQPDMPKKPPRNASVRESDKYRDDVLDYQKKMKAWNEDNNREKQLYENKQRKIIKKPPNTEPRGTTKRKGIIDKPEHIQEAKKIKKNIKQLEQQFSEHTSAAEFIPIVYNDGFDQQKYLEHRISKLQGPMGPWNTQDNIPDSLASEDFQYHWRMRAYNENEIYRTPNDLRTQKLVPNDEILMSNVFGEKEFNFDEVTNEKVVHIPSKKFIFLFFLFTFFEKNV